MSKEKLIDLDREQLDLLHSILKRHIPNKTVWAYGSRATWKAKETSDLDLAVFDCTPTEIYHLKEELEESDLLVSVDVMDWESIPESFRENIREKYVVVQEEARFPENWRKTTIGEITRLNRNSVDKNYNFELIQYLDTGSITSGQIEALQTYQLSEAPSRARRLVKDQDIVYSTVRPIQRHYGYLKRPPANLVVSTAFSVIETIKSSAEPLFVYYLLTTENNVEILDAIAEGSTSAYPSLRPSDIEKLEIYLPPLPEQKAIAEVLSSLDDKIDLLHRQNKTLEATAQALFRKWFVIEPKGHWEVAPLDSIADYLNGLACQKFPPPNETEKLPVLKIKELRGGFAEDSDWVTSTVDEKYIVHAGDVIFSWSGSLMLKIWPGQKCVLNQHLFKVTSDSYPKWFFFFWIKHHLNKFIKIADSKATTMGHIKRSDLSNSMVLIPDRQDIEKMNSRMEPEFEKIITNNAQIQNLENLREILLPKLMNGAVRLHHT